MRFFCQAHVIMYSEDMFRNEEKSEHKDLPTTLESLDTGDGLYIAIGDPLPNGDVKVNYFYSNEIPKLKAKVGNTVRQMKISYDSVAYDNNQLLHLLFGKTKKFREQVKEKN